MTLIENEYIPVIVGCPLNWNERVLEDALPLTPGGNDPETTLHVYGAQPPLALIVAENDVATVPFGTVVVVMATGCARQGTASNSRRGRAYDFMQSC
jgi:hypothetical protein